MNLYEKIQRAKVELAKHNLKMTGNNTYAGYKYYELADFSLQLNAILDELKVCTFTSFTAETATLTAVNAEKPDEVIVITSPMGTANLKGCHEVQNIGAVETYQRRYLYQALFDIVESDALNATQGKEKAQPPASKKQDAPFPEAKKLTNVDVVKDALKGTSWGIELAERKAMKEYGRSIEELNDVQLKQLVLDIENSKGANNG